MPSGYYFEVAILYSGNVMNLEVLGKHVLEIQKAVQMLSKEIRPSEHV